MRAMFLAAFLSIITACGGGGGGSAPGNPPPPPPPPPSSGGTLPINDTTADAIGLGIVMTEGSLQFAQSVADSVLDYMKPDGGPDQECDGGAGSKSAFLTDSDGNFFVSAGDVLTIMYTDCLESAVDDLVNGTLTISISELEFSATRLSIAGQVTTTPGFNIVDQVNPAGIVGVDADVDFSFVVDSSEILQLSATGNQSLTLIIDGFNESIDSFLFRKTALPPPPGGSETRWSTEIDVQEFYNSGALGGSFTCASTSFTFAPSSATSPSNINLVCTGLNGSAVRVINQRTVELDDDANGSFILLGQLDWNQVSEGFLGRAVEVDLAQLRGPIPIGTIQISANDVVTDTVGSRILMTASDTDVRFPNSLVSIDNATGSVSQLVAFSQEPNLVRVAADGSLLYVTFVDSGTVHRYSAADNRLQDSTDIRFDPPFSDQERILDLAVSPIEPNLYATVFRFSDFVRHEVALVQGTTQLANTYRDIEPNLNPDRYDFISFSSDGSTIIADAKTLLSFDQAGFTSTYKARLSTAPATEFTVIGNTIHTGSVAMDESTLIRTGEYPVNGAKWAFDAASELAFIYASSNFHVVLRDQFSWIADYRLNLRLPFGDVVSKMISSAEHVYLLRRDLISVLRISDVEIQLTQECLPSTLMTGENEPYTNYQCSLRAATYDNVKDKIYLGLSDVAGENGNSIAVVDGQTGNVETYVRVNARPSQMTMASDSSTLFISFDSADRIAELNPDTLTVDRETPIPLVPPIPPSVEARPRVAIDMRASSADSELAVVEVGVGYHTLNLEEYVAIRTGAWLPNILQRNNFGSVQDRVLNFDDSGALYNIGRELSNYAVEEMSADPNGLSSVSTSSIARPSLQVTEHVISNGEATVLTGDVIDLGASTVQSHYDMASAPGIFGNGNTGEYVLVDEPNGHTYFAYDVSGLPVPSVRIARFNTASGQFEASEAYEATIDRFVNTPFFEIGNDRLGLILSGSRGLHIIDKSSIN